MHHARQAGQIGRQAGEHVGVLARVGEKRVLCIVWV